MYGTTIKSMIDDTYQDIQDKIIPAQSWSCGEVPLRMKSVNDIADRYYAEGPARFHGKLKVAVHPDWVLSSSEYSRVKPVSPMEGQIAFLLPLDWKKNSH